MLRAVSTAESGGAVLPFLPGGRRPDGRRGEPDPAPARPSAELAELFDRHHRELVQFLSIRLDSMSEAEEVAQEAFMRLLQSESLGRPDNLKGLLFVTARNISTDRLRRRTRERAYERQLAGGRSEVPSPERILAGRETLMRISALIEELPPKCRDAFTWYKLHGLDYAEIALRMGLTESMIRKYVLRALAHLARGLDRQEAP